MQTRENEIKLLVEKTLRSLNEKPSSKASPTVTNAPVVALVNRIIGEAIDLNAGDIHLEPLEESIRVRIRIDGILRELCPPLPLKLLPFITGRIKVMSGISTVESRLPQDGRISFPHRGKNIDIRVSSLPVIGGEKFVLRLLDVAHRLLDIYELDFSAENEAVFQSWLKAPYGLVLNVGPVNSGKTTTLYAAISELNSPQVNIVTVEDPVEYKLTGINQLQVNEKTELTFARGLRAILRQDPDIVMLGEIRDEETAQTAIRAALTGHLLFSTLHTADAIGAVYRLIDMGVQPYLLSASLLGIMAQRLVRRLCVHCREEYEVEEGSPDALLFGEAFSPPLTLYRAKGCEKCGNTGYSGRIAVHELLTVTDALKSAITNNTDRTSLEKSGIIGNFRPMLFDAIQKAKDGKTSLAEIRRVLLGE